MAARTEGVLEEFPAHALLPKRETQVESFLRKYPEYNGDNVLIAIFDTGVDPGAPGLRVCPSGKRKIVDLIDCSGCGDVDTSTIQTVSEEGTITLKSGLKFNIPPAWNNPSGKFHIGIKSVYSLYPLKARKRVQDEFKEDYWNPLHKPELAKAVSDLSQFNIKCPSPSSEAEKLEHENLSCCVEALKLFEKNYKDKGPFVDCVVFHDGEMWRACIDTSEHADSDEYQVLGPFNLTGDYGRISNNDMVNYSINVYEDGNRLSIVTQSGSHGTHVACIAGAYFENEAELNGLAPGAQIISMQIGDNRINGMETGTALIRAMKCAINNKVDIINMSYGEASKWAGCGRVFDIMKKMITEHNIIFVSSAGNAGPALSTVGAPVSISNDIIGVGAYVSTDMMVAEYSLLEKMGGTQYTWSSNGPCADGKLGVCIVAPGGAVTSVPNWTLSKGQLMNGTSMSSPNACGSIAVLLSALKSQHIAFSPPSIRRCLENTALKIEGLSAFVQGQGMVQVDKAFEYMKEATADIFLNHVTFNISCGNGSGFYIREDSHRLAHEKHTVQVQPKFHKNTDNKLKIEFNKKLALVSTQSWITCATHVQLNNSASNFEISIKKSALKPGCHYGEVQGFDLTYCNLGALFRVPVTVIIPESIKESNTINLGNLTYAQGGRKRWFYSVPHGSTWARLTLKALDNENKYIRYVVHALQLLAESANCEYQFHKYVTINPSLRKMELVFKVQGGYTMELSIARWWSVSGNSELSAEISFHGLSPDHKEVMLHGPNSFFRLNVTSHLSAEQICPSASLTHHVVPLSPKDSLLKPLGEREPVWEKVYSLELTYNFHVASSCEVTVLVPLLRDVLYESHFESQFWMIYDSHKSLCGYGDALNISRQKYFYQLEKGDYVIKLQVRHCDYVLLDRMKDMTANIYLTLASAIVLDSYSSRANIFEMDKKKMFPVKTLSRLSTCPVYLTLPSEDKFPKGIKSGEYLLGKMSFTNDDDAKKVCMYPLTVTLAPAKTAAGGAKKDCEVKPLEDEYEEAHQEFLAGWVTKLHGLDLQKELLQNINESLVLRNAFLNALDESKNRTSNLLNIVRTAKEIIHKIDQTEILAYIAMKVDLSDKSSKKKKEIEKQKEFLINALFKMSLAVADGILAQSTTKESETESIETSEEDVAVPAPQFLVEDLDRCYRDFAKFVDATDGKMLMVIVRHGMVHQHYGRAIKALMKYFEINGTTKALYDVYLKLAKLCQWQHVVQYISNTSFAKFPPNYELF